MVAARSDQQCDGGFNRGIGREAERTEQYVRYWLMEIAQGATRPLT